MYDMINLIKVILGAMLKAIALLGKLNPFAPALPQELNPFEEVSTELEDDEIEEEENWKPDRAQAICDYIRTPADARYEVCDFSNLTDSGLARL